MKENEEKNKGLHIFLLVVGSILYIVLMVMMSSSNTGGPPAESGPPKSTVNYNGVLAQVQVIISQPSTFEQSEEICDHLKEKKSIILNLEYVNKDVARRIVDFVSGSVCALDGTIQKISNSIFLVAPHNYEITNEVMKEDIKNKLSVSWIK